MMALAIAVAGFAGCQKVEESIGDKLQMTVEASQVETKTVLMEEGDAFKVGWSTNDAIAVFETAGGTSMKYNSAGLGGADWNAKFSVALEKRTATSFDYSAVYPASAVSKVDAVWTITLPQEQKQAGYSFDKDADILIAGPETKTTQPMILPMSFARLGAILRVSVTGLPEGEKIQSLKVTSDGALLSGTWSFNPATGEAEIQSKGENNVTVTTSDNVIYVRTMACTTSSLSFVITTDKQKYGKIRETSTVLKDNSINCFSFDISSASTPMDGSGTKTDPYILKTPDDLKNIASNLVLDETTYFVMANDIDLAATENWVPINPTALNMRMDLDGKGFTIKNLKSTNGGKYTSFCGLLAGSIRNLNFDNAHIISTTPGGVVAGWVGISNASFTAECENVHVTNSVVETLPEQSAQMVVGGFAGRAGGATFKNCSFQGTVTCDSNSAESMVGGFVAETNPSCTLENISVEATVTNKGARNAGGLIAKALNDITVDGATFKGTVTGKYDIVGGAIGRCVEGEFNNIKVEATISAGCTPNYTGANYYSYCGGIIGYSGATADKIIIITNCSFKGDITCEGGKVVAGIIGQTSSNFTANNNVTEGTIKCKEFAAGLVGYAQRGSDMTATNCHNKMAITTTGGYTAGLVGMNNNTLPVTLKNCSNSGNITAGGNCGGLFGRNNTNCKATIERCWNTGNITSTASNNGGIIGSCNTGSVTTIKNCYSTGDVKSTSSYVGGISGCLRADSSVSNCYSTGSLEGNFGIGGITTRTCNAANLGTNIAVANNITVENCIAWNPSIKTITAGGESPAVHYSGGAVVGYSATLNTLKGCIRRPDMVFEYYPAGSITVSVSGVDYTFDYTGYNELYDMEDSSPDNPLTKKYTGEIQDKYYIPYHGKAAAAGATLSAVAQAAGWDASIWDFSKDEPVLK